MIPYWIAPLWIYLTGVLFSYAFFSARLQPMSRNRLLNVFALLVLALLWPMSLAALIIIGREK